MYRFASAKCCATFRSVCLFHFRLFFIWLISIRFVSYTKTPITTIYVHVHGNPCAPVHSKSMWYVHEKELYGKLTNTEQPISTHTHLIHYMNDISIALTFLFVIKYKHELINSKNEAEKRKKKQHRSIQIAMSNILSLIVVQTDEIPLQSQNHEVTFISCSNCCCHFFSP